MLDGNANISIITLKVKNPNIPRAAGGGGAVADGDRDCKSGSSNKIQFYVVYKKPTLTIKAHTD